MGYYDYKELRAAATASGATQADINALGKWCSEFGTRSWNGEFYDIDDGLRLFPTVTEDESGDIEVTGYEIR